MNADPGAHDSRREAFAPLIRRAILLVALLAAEYVLLALRFDGLLYRYDGWWQELAHLVTFIVVSATGVLVLSGAQVARALREHARMASLPPLAPGLFVNALATLGTFLIGLMIESRSWPPSTFGLMAATLGACGLISTFGAMLAALRAHVWRSLASHLRMSIVFGIFAGVCAFFAGLAAELLWAPLSSATLTATHAVLSLFFDDVVVLPDARILGVDRFVVEVAKECSGLEGMGLMLTFASLYVWQNRARLRFPAALALVPLSVAAMYGANLVRIVVLMWIGANYSPEVALGGFHSKAGWVFFCAITLGFVALATRWRAIQRDDAEPPSVESTPSAAQHTTPASPYLMPFIAVVGTGLVSGMFEAGTVDAFYGLRVLAALVTLVAYREALLALPWRLSLAAPVVGVAVFVLWLWLAPHPSAERHAAMHEAMFAQGPFWLVLRVIGSTLSVPIVEELAFRGFLMRRVVSADFEQVAFSHRSAMALIVSSLVFGALHQGQVVAGCVAGLGFGLAMLHRGSLGDAVVAHAITNALLVAYAFGFDRFAYL